MKDDTQPLSMDDALRRRTVNELDCDNLAEEIESVGGSERREILAIHLLKWRYQPEKQGDSWRASVSEARRRIDDVLTDNPSLRSFPADAINPCLGSNCCICPGPALMSRMCYGMISGPDRVIEAEAQHRPAWVLTS